MIFLVKLALWFHYNAHKVWIMQVAVWGCFLVNNNNIFSFLFKKAVFLSIARKRGLEEAKSQKGKATLYIVHNFVFFRPFKE